MLSRKTLVLTLTGVILVVIVTTTLVIHYLSPLLQTEVKPDTHPSKIIVYAYNDEISGIDPSIEDDTGLVVLGILYETLTYYNYKTGEIEPRLATGWEYNEDGTEWIFYLRNDVLFHDHTPFNSTAVKISVERARDIYRETGRGLGYIWDAVEDIEIIDDYTIKFKLSYPQKLDLLASAAYSAYIFSPSVLDKINASSYTDKKLEEWFNEGNAIGTGPYRLVSYDPTREIKLEKFNEWWGWKEVNNPHAPDIVIIRIITEPTTQYNALLAGQIDIAASVPRAGVGDLLNKGFKKVELQTYHNFILFFNTKRPPTNNLYFRQAIAHLLNLTMIVDSVLLGYGRPASGVIPYGFPGHVDNLIYEYNVEKANEYFILSNISLPVEIELLYQVDYEETVKFAQIFKTIAKDTLNIDVRLNPQSWIQLRDIARGIWDNPDKTPHLIIADWWPTVPSPYDYLYTMFHGDSLEWNFAGYEDEEFNELIDTAWIYEGIDYSYALELYRKAQLKIFEETIAIGLWDEIRPFVYSNRIDLPEEALNPMYMFVIRFEQVRVR